MVSHVKMHTLFSSKGTNIPHLSKNLCKGIVIARLFVAIKDHKQPE